MSDLKLLLFQNPSSSFIYDNISDEDKARIINWHNKYCKDKEFEEQQVIDLFIWCFNDGNLIADYEDPKLFGESFEKKSHEIGIDKNTLIKMFFSHANVFNGAEFEDQNKLSDEDQRKGLFIVFEGLDGSGKSTQINILLKKLRSIGMKVYSTAEPTNSATGGLIRDTLSNNYKRNASELAAIFLADRISHNVNPQNGIKKFLDEGITVVCDRYYYSSFAYQGLEADVDWIMDINLKCKKIIKPDMCIFLDVNVESCKNRVDSERVHLEIFESNFEIMAKVREKFFEVFRKLKGMEKIFIIDANRPTSDVSEDIFEKIVTSKKFPNVILNSQQEGNNTFD